MRAQGNGELIGASAAIVELIQEIDRIARSDAKVLITGESGVGKELVATAIELFTPVECANFVRHCGYRLATTN